MGGYGSGRPRWRARHLVDGVPSVDIRRLARQVRRDGRQLRGARIHLQFEGATGRDRAATVAIAGERITTPRGDRGERLWFVCPRCSRRVAVIYLPREGAGCRRCSGLRYASQYLDAYDRALRQLEKIRRRLDPDDAGAWYEPLPRRPPTMRRSTYRRLQERADDAWDARNAVLDAKASAQLARRIFSK